MSTNQANTGTTSTGKAEYETINGIEVPPEPDPALNNATLAGVDLNENGVRDDVERYIAEKAKNNEIFKTEFETVRLTNLILISARMSQKEMDAVKHDLNCIGLKGVKLGLTSDADILSLILNTQERSASYKLKTE